jgi:hypothetical protein
VDFLLLQSRAGEVEFYPPERPASATCRFLSPSGTELATPAVVVDTVSRTITDVTSDFEVTVSGSTGTPKAGRSYWWVSSDTGAQEALLLLSEVVSATWLFQTSAPTSVPKLGDLIRGARLTTTVPLSATGTRDRNYQIEWTVTGADGVVRVYTSMGHVVRTLYRPACDAAQARDYLARTWPDMTESRSFGDYLSLARRASERVWKRIRTAGRFQDLIGDPNDFRSAGDEALGYELARDGMIPAAVIDRDAYMERQLVAIQREIDDAIGSRPYDDGDTGDLTQTAATSRPITAIAARRV